MHQNADVNLLWPFLVYGIAVVSLVGGILSISYFLGERHEEHATDEAYEGGIIATGTAKWRSSVDFYIMMRTDGKNFPINARLPHSSLAGLLILTLLGGAVIWLGIFPAWLMNMIDALT